jgi:VWFA-related protein
VRYPTVRRLITAALIAGAAATSQTPAPAQSPQPEPNQQPPIRVEANFVRVDAYPTRDGRPVMDLRADEFDLFEDGRPQKIDTFEHVVVRGSVPQELRAEPNSIESSNQLAANPRNRVFVVFLDVGHVTVEGAWHIREPLIRLIDRILGPDDLVGIMTPRMSARDVVLARKTLVMASGLRDRWPWGERFTLLRDEKERTYGDCYDAAGESEVTKRMIARRRERMTLDALRDLVHHLSGIREERKAVLTVTEGWLLYRPDATLADFRPATPPPPHVNPDGRISVRRDTGFIDRTECDTDRVMLASIDNWDYMRDLMGDANRANTTFYTIDPRGLAASDSPIGPEAPPPPELDRALLRVRHDSMEMLAGNTDGMTVATSNDLDKGLRRIAEDLSSYYLLGYYSTNTKLDGRFRNITVKVRRPGVSVRARRGYRAATAIEVTAARAAASAPVPEATTTVKTAIAGLSRIRADARLVVNAVPVPAADSAGNVATVWVAGELPPTPSVSPGATERSVADIDVSGNGVSATSRVVLAPGQRAFVTPVRTKGELPGAIDVRVRVSSAQGSHAPLIDTIRIEPKAGSMQALLFRRGPSTGNRLQPAADFRFSRTERAHLELAAGPETKADAGRMLDAEGQPLSVPVSVGERVDAATGQRWITADVVLAPLAAADYAIEIGIHTPAGEQKIVTPIRIGR